MGSICPHVRVRQGEAIVTCARLKRKDDKNPDDLGTWYLVQKSIALNSVPGWAIG